jgi:hypothetical protein
VGQTTSAQRVACTRRPFVSWLTLGACECANLQETGLNGRRVLCAQKRTFFAAFSRFIECRLGGGVDYVHGQKVNSICVFIGGIL